MPSSACRATAAAPVGLAGLAASWVWRDAVVAAAGESAYGVAVVTSVLLVLTSWVAFMLDGDKRVGNAGTHGLAKQGNLWMVRGEYYDLTQFMDRHPGGRMVFEQSTGKDITASFMSHHLSLRPVAEPRGGAHADARPAAWRVALGGRQTQRRGRGCPCVRAKDARGRGTSSVCSGKTKPKL